MKKHLLTLLLMIGLCVTPLYTAYAQEPLSLHVTHPTIVQTHTDRFTLEAIGCTPDTTTLWMDVYERKGNQVCLTSGIYLKGHTTGRIYKLLRAEGIALDHKVVMPASGNIRFQLHFEPLDRRDMTIDLVGENTTDNPRLEGISLTDRPKGSIICHLEGTVDARPEATRLVLVPDGTDIRIHPFLSIPVHDGKFSYDLHTDVVQAWTLYLWHDYMRGSIRTGTFLSENGTIRIHLPVNAPVQIQSDTPENARMQAIRQSRDSIYQPQFKRLQAQLSILEEAGQYHSPMFKTFYARFDSLIDNPNHRVRLFAERDSLERAGAFYTPEGNRVNKQLDQLSIESDLWKLGQATQQPSLYGFYLLHNYLQSAQTPDTVKKACERIYRQQYMQLYPKHPYHRSILSGLASLLLRPGQPYPDCTVNGPDGLPTHISHFTQGKIALIDFWASWCGPCRLKARQMIPIYEQFKDRGFTIVGIAREQNKADAERAIRQDGYPWLNLLELHDEHQIWLKHGLSNSGGGTLLLDRDGIIRAVNPTPEQVNALLEEWLPIEE